MPPARQLLHRLLPPPDPRFRDPDTGGPQPTTLHDIESFVWDSLRAVMAPGALDPVVKEMLYLAVSMTSGCAYCTASHTAAARAKGMTEPQFGELLAIVGMAAETNRLAEALRVPVDPQFD